jgi:hypothetical protein
MKNRTLLTASLFCATWVLLFLTNYSALAQNRTLELGGHSGYLELLGGMGSLGRLVTLS